MTRKIYSLFVLILCVSICTTSIAQDDNSSYQGLKFSSQPKHQSEIGVHAGHFMVVGDVLPRPSWGVGVHFRRAFDYAFAWRIDFLYGQAKGLEPRNSGTVGGPASANSVLRSLGYGNGTPYFHNYKTDFMSLTAQGIWSLNSFGFKKKSRKVNWYVFAGAGLNSFKAYYDALNGSTPYDFSSININGLETSRDARKDAKDALKDLLDGDYETRAEVARGRRSGDNNDGDEFKLNIHANAGFGVSFKLSEKINLSLEHQATIIFGNEGDLVDGYRWRTTQDLTQYRDLVNYTNVRFNFNLGKGEDRSEPLWWVSPMDLIAEDLAEVKARPILDMTDSDKDGVIDMIDQEKDTREGCPVDTRGIILDSDADGIVDCDDDEPHSPPGFKVDTKGIAQVPDPGYTNETDVNRIVDAKLGEFKATLPTPDPTDWFLPMVHFDLDKYSIKGSEYAKLHHVATVLKLNPSIRVVANGHTDRLAGNCYNDVLSYNRANAAIDYLVSKYGIPRDRFILNWGGENNALIPSNGSNLINRRVEFMVATDQSEMGRPNCGVDKAGSGGSKYSGNKEAGY